LTAFSILHFVTRGISIKPGSATQPPRAAARLEFLPEPRWIVEVKATPGAVGQGDHGMVEKSLLLDLESGSIVKLNGERDQWIDCPFPCSVPLSLAYRHLVQQLLVQLETHSLGRRQLKVSPGGMYDLEFWRNRKNLEGSIETL
jgi:hypothetical protein